MKLRVERESFADAVTWTAKTLAKTAGATSGILLEAAHDEVSLSSCDQDVSSVATLDAVVDEPGKVLVSGRLLADIARSLPSAPVSLVADAGKATLTCGRSKFTLPLLKEDDYPPLPMLPPVVGKVSGGEFARAVSQAYVATAKGDSLPVFNGIRLEINGDELTLAATDRYRLTVRELNWKPETFDFEREIVVPGRALNDVAKSLAGAEYVHLALVSDAGSDRTLGIVGDGRRFTTRLLDGQFPKFRDLLPPTFASHVRVDVAELSDAIKRVALVERDVRNPSVTFTIKAEEIELTVGVADETSALEAVAASLDGTPMTIAFNPHYLLDCLGALESKTAVIRLNEPTKPVVIVGADDFDADPDEAFRYLLMPINRR